MKKFLFLLQLVPAVLFLQTLFFKFTGAEESIYIFMTLGMEPEGRYLSGIGELVASILLLIPSTAVLGALLGLGIISGAILSHLAVLGIEIMGDGGLLFGLACLIFVCCLLVLLLRFDDLRKYKARYLPFLPFP